MRAGLIMNAALLLGNMAAFLWMSDGLTAKFHNAGGATAFNSTIQQPTSTPDRLGATLDALIKEQSLLRAELERVKTQGMKQQPANAMEGSHSVSGCQEGDDYKPGVTVYLETTPAEVSPGKSPPSGQQWTSVSFREVGQSPDGSKQAVMSIHKTHTVQDSTTGLHPVRNDPNWQ